MERLGTSSNEAHGKRRGSSSWDKKETGREESRRATRGGKEREGAGSESAEKGDSGRKSREGGAGAWSQVRKRQPINRMVAEGQSNATVAGDGRY